MGCSRPSWQASLICRYERAFELSLRKFDDFPNDSSKMRVGRPGVKNAYNGECICVVGGLRIIWKDFS
jgi:hypothetical protein